VFDQIGLIDFERKKKKREGENIRNIFRNIMSLKPLEMNENYTITAKFNVAAFKSES